MSNVIIECHVKGATEGNSKVPFYKRGNFLGLCDEAMIEHFHSVGATHVQIMPVFDCLETFWAYDPVSWVGLNPKYGTRSEFFEMVDTLQANGLKVILDVVYNHTARPIEGVVYGDDKKCNFSGCGGNVIANRSLDVIMESVDYWMQFVDGMRFDLGYMLGREDEGDFNPNAEFFNRMHKHHLAGKVLITESWDASGGYGLNQFRDYWLEFNDQFRECIKAGNEFHDYSSLPWHKSINYGFCHDGETMYDHVRRRQNYMGTEQSYMEHMTWLFKQIRMGKWCLIQLGDTVANSQNGHTNPYNIDSPLSWVTWP